VAETKKQLLLRLDPKLWAEIQSWSEQEMRSINGQIEYLLKDAVVRRKRSSENSDRE
jgi:hypothetical protein